MTLEIIILIAAFVALVGLITYAMIRTLRRNDQLIDDWKRNCEEVEQLAKRHKQIGEAFKKANFSLNDLRKAFEQWSAGEVSEELEKKMADVHESVCGAAEAGKTLSAKSFDELKSAIENLKLPTPDYPKGCNDAPSGYDKFEHPYLHLDVDNSVKAWVDAHKPITEEQAMNNAKLFMDMGVLLEKYMRYINHIEGTTYTADYLMCECPQLFTVEEQEILKEIRNKINSEA